MRSGRPWPATLAGALTYLLGRRILLEQNLRNRRTNRGAFVEPANLAFRGDPDALAAAFTPDSWRPSAPNVGYVRAFFDLARSRGIRVYWVIPPFCPAIEARRAEKGLDRLYDRFVAGVVG